MADAIIGQAVPELPISKAAGEILFFEKATLFSGSGRVALGEALSRNPVAPSFLPVRTTASVRNFRLREVILDADTMLLLKGDSVIPETSYFVPDDRYAQTRIRADELIRLDAGEDIIIGHNLMHWGYLHWLTQCVPAIDWSLRHRVHDHIRLALPHLRSWQEDMLALLGYGDIPRLVPKARAQYLLPRAEYSQFINGSTAFSVCLSTLATCQRLLSAVRPRPSPHSVVYVPCPYPHYGRLANEEELIDLLERRGAYILSRDNLTTIERLNLFRQADVVIGPHAEGLTDVLFCKSGSLLWELMPSRYQNTCYNRLAQAAEVDYWGDSFPSDESGPSREWRVDLRVVSERLSATSRRLALRAGHRSTANAAPVLSTQTSAGDRQRGKPLDELMLEFESLGDNCEFGLVQRAAGVEPLGLLRFAGLFLPIEIRLERLVAALNTEFDQLGAPGTVTVELAGEEGRREYLVKETAYHLMYHTFVREGEIEAEELHRREATRLAFLRRKLLEDLREATKIWVWKSPITTTKAQISPLIETLRRFGANTLLWVVEGDAAHQPGTIEQIDDDLIKGYIERFAPYENATDIRPYTWFEVCQKTFNLCRAPAEEEPLAEPPTAAQQPGAMDYLLHSVALDVPPAPATRPRGGLLRWLTKWFRRR